MSSERTDRKRPSSEELIDLHVSVVPPEYWNQKLNHASERVIEETFSAGFVRVHGGKSIASLRQVISDQIGDHLFSTKYVFLKHIGRCLAMVNEKQETQLSAKNFIPPQNNSPEIFILPILPSTYNQRDHQEAKFLPPPGGRSQFRSENNSKLFGENDQEENSLISAQFPTSRGISQRSQLTPVRQTNSTEHWQHEIPDTTLERFVSGKSAARGNDILQANQAGDASSDQGRISSRRKHHSYEQQSSGFVSPQRQANISGPESHLSYNESTPSNDFDKSQPAKQPTGNNFVLITDHVIVNKENSHSSSNSGVFHSNPARNHENPSTQIHKPETAGRSDINPYHDDSMSEKRIYFDRKTQNFNHEYNNTEIAYVADTIPSQLPLQTMEKDSLFLPVTGASGIKDEMSPVSYTEHKPQNDIQHVHYVKKNNDSLFIENPHDFDDENQLEMRRSKLSGHQKQRGISHNTPQIVEENEGHTTRFDAPAKMSYRQTHEDTSHFAKERNHTPEWGENTSEYSVRDSDASSVLGNEFLPAHRYSSIKSENPVSASNETPYHYDNNQKLKIESGSQEENHELLSSHKLQKSEPNENGKIVIADGSDLTHRRNRSIVSFRGEDISEPRIFQKGSVSDESSVRRRNKQQFVDLMEQTEYTLGQAPQTFQRKSVSDESTVSRRKKQFIGSAEEADLQQKPLTEQQKQMGKEGDNLIGEFSRNNHNFESFRNGDNFREKLNGEELPGHDIVENFSGENAQRQYSENNENEIQRHADLMSEKDGDQNHTGTEAHMGSEKFTTNNGDRERFTEGDRPKGSGGRPGEFSENRIEESNSKTLQPTYPNQEPIHNYGIRKFSKNLDEEPNTITSRPTDQNHESSYNELNPVLLSSMVNAYDEPEYSEFGQRNTINEDKSKYNLNSEAFLTQLRDNDRDDPQQRVEIGSTNDDGSLQDITVERSLPHHFSRDDANLKILSDSKSPEKDYNDKENVSEFLPHRGHPDGMPVHFAAHRENLEMNHDKIVSNQQKNSQGRTATPVPKPIFIKPPKDSKQKVVSDNLNALDEASGSSSRTTTIKTNEHGNLDCDMKEAEDIVYRENDRGSSEDYNESMQKRKLYNELQKIKERRMNFEKQREDLVKKAKNTAQQINHRRGAGRDVWKRRYFNEKKKTASLTDLCERLNHQYDSFHKKWPPSIPPISNAIANDKAPILTRTDERPSIKSNSKIQATRTLMSIEDLKKRLNDAKLRLTGEVKMRHEAEQELKNMKQGLLAKKIQSHVAYRKMNRFRGYSNSQNVFYNQSLRSNNGTFHARLR